MQYFININIKINHTRFFKTFENLIKKKVNILVILKGSIY